MTESQQRMARALAQVVMCPGIATKRFAREMAHHAAHQPAREITDRQAKYLREAVVRYRRQIQQEVVLLAEAEIAAVEAVAA